MPLFAFLLSYRCFCRFWKPICCTFCTFRAWQVWTWLIHGFVPLIAGSNEEPGVVRKFNQERRGTVRWLRDDWDPCEETETLHSVFWTRNNKGLSRCLQPSQTRHCLIGRSRMQGMPVRSRKNFYLLDPNVTQLFKYVLISCLFFLRIFAFVLERSFAPASSCGKSESQA